MERESIQKKLNETDDIQKKAAAASSVFRQGNKIITLKYQNKTAITVMANIKDKIAFAENDYGLKTRAMTSSHPKVQDLLLKMTELKKQVKRFESGTNTDSSRFSIPISQIPNICEKYFFFLQYFEMQKARYKAIAPKDEMARLKELKDSPTIQVLNKPQKLQKDSKPKHGILIGILKISGAFLRVFIIIFFKKSQQFDLDSYQQLRNSPNILKSDFSKNLN